LLYAIRTDGAVEVVAVGERDQHLVYLSAAERWDQAL
jgi:hypothetical protein